MPIRVDNLDGGIVMITLDDPERRNPLTTDMGIELSRHIEMLCGRDDTRVVVMTGAGAAFSSGGDLAMLENLATKAHDEDFDASETMLAFYNQFLCVRALKVPVVAAINGHAIGAGLCLALACDIRIVASDAKIGLNFSRLGLHPGMGATWLLQRLVGPMHAADLLFSGRLISGSEAVRRGLAVSEHPADGVLEAALTLAGEIASASPLVVRQLKQTLPAAASIDLGDALRAEAAAQAASYASDDLIEGLRAAREGTTPRFNQP